MMEQQKGQDIKDIKSESDANKHQDGHAPPVSDEAHRTPKKRRKVNHGKSPSLKSWLSL
jgi:hypothetical protein